MTTYAQLKMDIQTWAIADDQAAKVDTLILLAEERHRWGQVDQSGKRNQATGAIRVRAQEKRATIPGNGTDALPLPPNYLEHRWLHFVGATQRQRELKYVGTEHIAYAANSRATQYTITRNELLFNGNIGAELEVEMVYYGSFTALSDANPTNWLVANAYGCYLWAAVAEMYGLTQDWSEGGGMGGVEFAEGKYAQSVSALMESEQRARHNQGATEFRMSGRSTP